MRFRDYLAASPGMIPATVLYVYCGKLAGDVAQIAAGEGLVRGATGWLLFLLGLIATLAATVVLHRAARRALAEFDEDASQGA